MCKIKMNYIGTLRIFLVTIEQKKHIQIYHTIFIQIKQAVTSKQTSLLWFYKQYNQKNLTL